MGSGLGVDRCNGSKGASNGFGNSTDNGLDFAQRSTVLMGREKKKYGVHYTTASTSSSDGFGVIAEITDPFSCLMQWMPSMMPAVR